MPLSSCRIFFFFFNWAFSRLIATAFFVIVQWYEQEQHSGWHTIPTPAKSQLFVSNFLPISEWNSFFSSCKTHCCGPQERVVRLDFRQWPPLEEELTLSLVLYDNKAVSVCAETLRGIHLLVVFLIQFLRWPTLNICKSYSLPCIICASLRFFFYTDQQLMMECRNLAQNQLSGQLSDMFEKLQKLSEL